MSVATLHIFHPIFLSIWTSRYRSYLLIPVLPRLPTLPPSWLKVAFSFTGFRYERRCPLTTCLLLSRSQTIFRHTVKIVAKNGLGTRLPGNNPSYTLTSQPLELQIFEPVVPLRNVIKPQSHNMATWLTRSHHIRSFPDHMDLTCCSSLSDYYRKSGLPGCQWCEASSYDTRLE